MNKILLSLSVFLFFVCPSFAQIHYGANGFTEYRKGNLPIIISIPHGGLIAPDSIPDRTCNNPTTVTDANTIELGLSIDSSFFEKTGCHIHLVICNLKRTKVDCNRNIADGACSQVQAMQAWTDFHDFIDSAQKLAVDEFNKAFYIDLHGHGKAQQRLELGYLLSDNAYELSDSILNTNTYINKSSLKNLANTNTSNSTHAELLRGDKALGTLLGNAGFPSVPSKQIPKPDTTTNYFDGGYNTENYTSKVAGKIVNGLQIECNNIGVRNNSVNRRKFADSLSSVLINYLSLHHNYQFNSCLTNGIRMNEDQGFEVFPNPVRDIISIKNKFARPINKVDLYDLQGRIVYSYKEINDFNNLSFSLAGIENGLYWIVIDAYETKQMLKVLILK